MACDYHVHTALCGHAEGEVAAYAERAIELGFREIGFADHLPMEVWGKKAPELSMALADMESYRDAVFAAREKYRSRIAVKFGIEADYIPGREKVIGDFLRQYEFDYVIGSVHFLGEWAMDCDPNAPEWMARPIDEIYVEYFTTVIRGIEAKMFDIIAHPDVVKKFGHRARIDLTPWYERFAAACAATGTVVEVSTAGWHRPVAEIYPHPEMIRACYRRSVPIVIDSDAHAPKQVGRDREKAAALAHAIGYRRTPSFTRRAITHWLELVLAEPQQP